MLAEQRQYPLQVVVLLDRQCVAAGDDPGDEVGGPASIGRRQTRQQGRDRRQCRLRVTPDQQGLAAHQGTEPGHHLRAGAALVDLGTYRLLGMAEMALVGFATGL